jgi:hypothetical protein
MATDLKDRKILKQQIIQEINEEGKEVLGVQFRDIRQKIKKSVSRDERKWAEDLAGKEEKA